MSGRESIGYRTDRFVCLQDGRLLNVDAVKRLVPCFTCGAAAGTPCLTVRGSAPGSVARTHQSRAYNEQYNGLLKNCPHPHSLRAIRWFAKARERRGGNLFFDLNFGAASRRVRHWQGRRAASHLTTVVQPDLEVFGSEASDGT